MRSFFKTFFASFFAITIFFILLVLAAAGLYNLVSSEDKPVVKSNTVLVLDVSKPLMEQPVENGPPFAAVFGEEVDGLYQLVRTIDAARSDSLIKGIYLVGTYNTNGFATSAELRQALSRFRAGGKFVVAYANYLDQRAYEVMSVADDLFLNPAGGLEWQGYSMQLAFFKNTLDKLEVKPEIFYAGQYKSATEPFRLTRMSDANRLQMHTFLEGLYRLFQQDVSKARGVDTAQLRQMATDLSVQSSHDAVRLRLADGVKYDDEVRALIARRTGAPSIDKINFMDVADYHKAKATPAQAKDQVAIIYAQGEIVDGRGQEGEIGGDTYRKLIRKVRLDKNVKAVVLRVNSPGGSAVASEVIHRELSLLQKEKPLVVSMGDYAASGGYYISCLADSIFAQPNSLTGSIGVFSMLFDVSKMMSSKLGITFDEVATSPSASLGSPLRPMTNRERAYFQAGVDSVYALFKRRVAAGRQLGLAHVDSIAQGRIWSGQDGVANGLVDRLGNINDAIACAARLAKLKDYRLREWPAVESFWEKLLQDDKGKQAQTAWHVRQQFGQDFYLLWKQMQQLRHMQGKAQMRLPFLVMPSGGRSAF